jgi:hypothetical protein
VERLTARLWFAHAYSCDGKKFRRNVELCRAADLLIEPDTPERDDESVAKASVIRHLDPRLTRWRWNRNVDLSVTCSRHRALTIASAKLLVCHEALSTAAKSERMIISLVLHLIGDVEPDDVIALVKSYEGIPSTGGCLRIRSDGTERPSIQALLDTEIRPLLGDSIAEVTSPLQFRICELPSLDRVPRHDLEKAYYGIITGDEGWRFVPALHARESLKAKWQTREFAQVLAFGCSVLMLNDQTNTPAAGAEENEFFDHWFSFHDRFFTHEFTTAGMAGGILWAVERVVLLTLSADTLMTEVAKRLRERRRYERFALPGEREGRETLNDARGSLDHIRPSFRELLTGNLRSVRLAVLSYVQIVTQPEVLELKTLQGFVASAAELDRRVAALERYGDAIDSELKGVATLQLNVLAFFVAASALVVSIIIAVLHA